jgi:hypothetical protein
MVLKGNITIFESSSSTMMTSEPSRQQPFLSFQTISFHPPASIVSETSPTIVPCAAIIKNCHGLRARHRFSCRGVVE